MGTLGTLAVSIIGDARELERTFDDVNKKTQDMGRSMQDMGRNVTNTGKKMSLWVTGPIVAVGGAITGLVMKTAAYGDELDKTSSKLGVSVEGLQDWRYWAEQNGIETSTLERSMGRLNQRIGIAATEGGKYADAFEALGVSVRDANGDIRETDEVMRDTIQSIMEFESPAERSAAAAEVFGTRVARDLMPALEEGSMSIDEAIAKMDEHGRVSEEQAAAAADFQDAIADLKTEFMAIVHEIGMDFLPLIKDELLPVVRDSVIPAIRDLADFIGGLIKWFTDLDPSIQKAIIAAIGIAAALGPVLIIVGKVITVVGTITTMLPVLGAAFAALTGPIGLIIAAIVAAVAIGWYLYNNWDEVKEAIGRVIDAVVDFFRELPGRIWNFLVEVVKRIIEWRSNMRTRALEVAKEVVNTFVEWIGKLPGKMLEAGRNIISNLVKGVRDAIPSIGGVMSSAAGAISNFWPFSPAKEGPLKQLPNFKSYLVDPAEDAIKDLQGLLRRDMDEIGQFLPGSITHEMRGGTVYHTGSLTFRGVNDQGQLVGYAEVAMDQIVKQTRRDGRRTANRISKY